MVLDLDVKCKTITLLEDNLGENLDDPGYGGALKKKKKDKLDFTKTKNFCSPKHTSRRIRKQLRENICRRHTW